ncbi:MAG: tyrosine-type recombinase/integrase [Microgenomates group bacterium]
MDNLLMPTLIEKFIKHLGAQNKSSFTIIAYKKDLEQFIGYLATQDIQNIKEVKKEHINGFVNKLMIDGYTKKSASRKLNSIRTFFRYLKHEGLIDHNPSLDVAHPKYTQNPPRIFSKLEYRALRDFAKEDPRTYALVETLLQTGMKIGELANLKIEDINDSVIHIRGYSKGSSRDVPINNALKKAIEEYLKVRPQSKDNHLFITRTGKPLLIRNIRQIISRCFKEVGIENATVNDLRNTFIAHQLMQGASVEYIAKLVGHKRLSSTERYLHLIKQETQRKQGIGEL